MSHFITSFTDGILTVVGFVMHYVGFADNGFTRLMIKAGIVYPRDQLYIYLGLMVVLVIVALRVLGGFLGWIILILLVLLLLHRVVPGLSVPNGAFQTPIQNVL